MNSTLARLDGRVPLVLAGWRGVLVDYYELTKPRIIYLLLITTLAAMVMAARGIPPIGIVLATIAGGALASASAGALNCVIDRDIDGLMRRTKMRPVVTGRISPAHAIAFAIVAGLLSFALLYRFTTPLAAWLSLAGSFYYVVIYTLLLKRTTALNIVVGGAAGAIPPLVGWAAVTGGIGGPAIGLFLLIFLWTPPHFWALALMTDVDYGRANIPMFPNIYGAARTKREILYYSLLMVGASIAFFAFHMFGVWYLAMAVALGGFFLRDAVRLFRPQTAPNARALFRFSLLYLALMSIAMVVDRIIA